MSSICVTGHLVGVPEVVNVKNKPVCTFSVSGHEKSAIDPGNHFFKCEAAGKLAEKISQNAREGMEVFIEGKYEAQNFVDENKNQIYDNRIIVEGFISTEIEHMSA